MLIKDYRPRVGDRIETNGDGRGHNDFYWLAGVVGELRSKGFLLFHSCEDCVGEYEAEDRQPEDYGELYTWYIRYDSTGQVNVLNRGVEPEREVRTPRRRVEYKQVVKKQKTMLNKITDALKRFLSPDAQIQYRAGYIDGGLELTERGINALLNLLAEQNAEKFTASAEAFIAEAEKAKKGDC